MAHHLYHLWHLYVYLYIYIYTEHVHQTNCLRPYQAVLLFVISYHFLRGFIVRGPVLPEVVL